VDKSRNNFLRWLPSGMLHRVVWWLIDVSELLSASIIRSKFHLLPDYTAQHSRRRTSLCLQMTVLWDIALCNLVEVGRVLEVRNLLLLPSSGYIHFCNVGLLKQDYTALYPRTLYLVFLLAVRTWSLTFWHSLRWEPEFSPSNSFLPPLRHNALTRKLLD
jgi:hypothetical protein